MKALFLLMLKLKESVIILNMSGLDKLCSTLTKKQIFQKHFTVFLQKFDLIGLINSKTFF